MYDRCGQSAELGVLLPGNNKEMWGNHNTGAYGMYDEVEKREEEEEEENKKNGEMRELRGRKRYKM